MTTGLVRGAYSGKETKLYYNSADYDTPTFVEIKRARNVTKNRGPALTDIEFHGAEETGAIPGYRAFNGSFEYVRRAGTDTVYAALQTAMQNGEIVDLVHLNGPIDEATSLGWRAPVLLGEFAETANGNDGVVVTIPFRKADAFDDGGVAVDYEAFEGSSSWA
jgi:hypothetical protein